MPSTPYRQLALQGAAIILVLSLAWPYFGWTAEALPGRETCLAIGPPVNFSHDKSIAATPFKPLTSPPQPRVIVPPKPVVITPPPPPAPAPEPAPAAAPPSSSLTPTAEAGPTAANTVAAGLKP